MEYNRKIVCKTGEVVYSYVDYLKTFHWTETRNACVDACGGVCLGCRKKGKKLQVHHLHYNTIGNEDKCDLKPLCRQCHEIAHGLREKKKVVRKKSSTKKAVKTKAFLREVEDGVRTIINQGGDVNKRLLDNFSYTKYEKIRNSKMWKRLIREYNKSQGYPEYDSS